MMPSDLRLSTNKKKGAPKNAVTTPIGSSAGDCRVRAKRSVRMRKDAPMKNDSGTTRRFDAPTTNRTACGTIIPTNAMSPLTATAEAAANEAAPMMI